MALVAVAPVVLGLQGVGPGVAEGERIALVVVVGLVERERVVDLELQVRIERPPELGRDAVVPRLGRALDDEQVADPVGPAGRQPRAPGLTEHRVVAR